MNNILVKNALYELFAKMLPKLVEQELIQLAHDEFNIMRKACHTYTKIKITPDELLNVAFFSTVEALEKYDETRNIPITNFIKYITKQRVKDVIRSWYRKNEVDHFVHEYNNPNSDGASLYEQSIDIFSCLKYQQNRTREEISNLMVQYNEKTNSWVRTRCIELICENYSASYIRRKLFIKRREYELLRDDFFDFVRKYWNYDNIY
ncbi:sigma factor [Spiroplasma clarkii]|uniref:Uncharacterized protein n=1 Tax=Spiroplasma clarkii TaxID=2139 RepID=A0A2K8KFA7_9MOLU|nr:sigma factor [Spiroplasma clarkii]ATX70370.1 hypothetical protein SCLAR_v1c00330 [Spiroplasma clarkii]